MKLFSNKSNKLWLFTTFIATASITSCKKDFGDINKSWDAKVYEPTIPALYNGITASLVEPSGTGNILTSWVYQNCQLAAMYAATGYRMDNYAGAYWNNYYNTLANARKLETLIGASPNAANMTNIKAMLKTLMAYKTLSTTMIYGDMPYADAAKAFEDAQYFRPKYDAQLDVIKSALADLKWAVENFSTASSQVSLGGSETLLANDIAKWVKFANSIRLRYAMTLQKKDAATSNTVLAEALAKPLLAANETIGLYPASIPNYTNDRGGWYRGNSYVRMGSTMWNAMSATNATDGSGIYDLRCRIFFEPNKAGEWVPYPQAPTNSTPTEIGNSGSNDPYSESRLTNWTVSGTYLYAPLNFYYVADKTFPRLLITGTEVSFLKAETYNKGIGGVTANPVTAKAAYDEGVTESVKFWYKLANGSSIWVVNKPAAAPTVVELNAMMANPAVAYSALPATALTQIYKQHWISLFHQPMEAWTLARRTEYATPAVALASSSPGYNLFRIIYPQSEIDGNYANWSSVTGGTDSPTAKPWFIK